jgi:hypothetical protein
LHFYNARWYDSSLGRFTSPDSIIPEQTQGVQAWDRYAYVNNNPMLYTDSTGHCIWDACIIEAAVAIGFFTMAIDYAVQSLTDHPEYLGPGCMWSRCGGFTDYLRDRGAVVWDVSSVVNTVSLGLLTPAVVGGTPIITNPIAVGGVTGTLNATQTIMEKGLLGEEINPADLAEDFGIGLLIGYSSAQLDQVAEESIASVQNPIINNWSNSSQITLWRSPELPISTNVSSFANTISKVIDYAGLVYSRVKEVYAK